ncbi:MAG: TetR/AcrR family transcriptional regulator [Rhodospirillales bacterium]
MLHTHNHPPPGDDAGGLTRFSEQKRRQILEAAGRLFLRQGFEATTMDAIAREAGVSKATVYAHAKNKQELFAGIVNARVALIYRSVELQDAEALGVEDALNRFARHFIQMILSPEAQGIYRIVVAEAPRNPELGRIFFEQGPRRVTQRLAAILEAQAGKGRLAVDDTLAAAQEFLGMLHGKFHLPCVLGVAGQPTAEELTRAAERVVRTFLKVYGAGP